MRRSSRSSRSGIGRAAAAGLLVLTMVGTLVGLAGDSRGQESKNAKPGPVNRLAGETSPYLLLHAHNPVNWFPWGPEAFARAKAENKPIFLSIGYSSCYWCHVMERESFTDAEIARLLNENFVAIKVDREERPDVDQVYMTALQAFSTGGWPMSMFLLPDGRPFFGGTYFPPRDREGFTGFATVLEGIAKAWKNERAEMEKAAGGLTEIVKRKLGGASNRRHPPLTREMAAEGRTQLAEQFDAEYGGFGSNPQNARRPKFPEPVNLVFLLDQYRRERKDTPRASPAIRGPKVSPSDPLFMVEFTLDHMARGGIRDQLAGGYHRYATSRFWIVPHFEKMLYDNAQLASVHLQAHELTGDPRWRDEAEATFAFVARTMTSPEGGFYSSLDAETAAGEGAYYVWSKDEVKEALGEGPELEAFSRVYGLKRDSNFEGGRYVLLEPRMRAEQAESLNQTPEALEARLRPLRARMLSARDRRQSPSRDDKILTAWNGLMIAAYADGFRVLKKDEYRKAAEKAAEFVLSKLRGPEGRLLRTYRAGQAKLPAYLEDYAFLVHGLLRLHSATNQARWLDQARALTDRMIEDFSDTEEGGFFFTADDHESLLARPKDPVDNALPSGNSMAVQDLLELHRVTDEDRYRALAGKTLEAFSTSMVQNPSAMPVMLVGLLGYLDAKPGQEARQGQITPRPLGEGALTKVPARVVAATASLADKKPAVAGREVEAIIALSVKDRWHIYANPTGVEILKPTTLAIEPGQPASQLEVSYPAGKAQVLDSLGKEEVSLYEGRADLKLRFRLAADAKPGKSVIKFRLKYQACNDRVCLAPANLTIPLELTIESSPPAAIEKP